MRPFFTSAAEWRDVLVELDEETYVRNAVGITARAGLLGLLTFTFVTPLASTPRPTALALIFAASYGLAMLGARCLFRREWRACVSRYGMPESERI